MGPGESSAEEIINVAHKFYPDFPGELGAKQFPLGRFHGVEHKIVNVDPNVKRRTFRQQGGAVGQRGVLDDALEGAGIVKRRSEFEFSKNGGECFWYQ